MLFNSKSIATGMSSHCRVRCVLSSVDWVPRDNAQLDKTQPDNAKPLPKQRLTHHLKILFRTTLFRTTAHIPHIVGGSYGDEFRPD